MKRVLLGMIIIGVGVFGWLLFQGDTINYVAEVEDEVTALEAELAEIEAAVEAGTLTPEAAAEAQTRIVARIDAVNEAVSAGQRARLTDEQRAQLVAGLDRLTRILTDYQSTLVVVDETVMELPVSERPQLNRGGGGGRSSVANIASDMVESIEQTLEEIIDTITDTELLETLLATSTDTTTATTSAASEETDTEADMSDTEATTSDESEADMSDTEAESTASDTEDTNRSSEPIIEGEAEATGTFTFDESEEATTTAN